MNEARSATPTHPPEALIHDFVDHELSGDERSRIAAHIAECMSCRAVAETARSLREEAIRVFGHRAPSDAPDQWPGIEARIRARPRFTWLTPLRAAAVILLAGASVTAYVAIRPAVEPVTQTGTVSGTATAALPVDPPATSIASAYAPALTELEGILEQGRDRLQPETIATLEENLEILNTAIRDIQDALAADPAHRGNLRSLDGMYHAKLDVLRQAVVLSRGTRSRQSGITRRRRR